MNLDTKKILAVIRSNLVIAICVVVIIGALVGLPYVSKGFQEEVAKAVDKKKLQLFPQPAGVLSSCWLPEPFAQGGWPGVVALA